MKYPYTTLETTPMRFLSVIRLLWTIGIVVQTGHLIILFDQAATAYEIILSIVELILSLAAILGFSSMKWYGVIAFSARFAVTIADSLFAILIVLILQTDYSLAAECVGRIAGALVWLIPSLIYFRKRRLLFTPWPRGIEKPGAAQPEPDTEPSADPEAPITQRFCRKCGGRLLPESLFCSHCGAALKELAREENVL